MSLLSWAAFSWHLDGEELESKAACGLPVWPSDRPPPVLPRSAHSRRAQGFLSQLRFLP